MIMAFGDALILFDISSKSLILVARETLPSAAQTTDLILALIFSIEFWAFACRVSWLLVNVGVIKLPISNMIVMMMLYIYFMFFIEVILYSSSYKVLYQPYDCIREYYNK